MSVSVTPKILLKKNLTKYVFFIIIKIIDCFSQMYWLKPVILTEGILKMFRSVNLRISFWYLIFGILFKTVWLIGTKAPGVF